ncbi:MAG: hypothetical protein ACE14P_01540 [Methanotrichaceae archaeon]
MIKIGIESTFEGLRRDILSHPEKFFFILVIDGQAALCIRTCNSKGNELQAHVIDGMVPDSKGNLKSIFEDVIRDALLEQIGPGLQLYDGKEYMVTGALGKKISEMPDLIEWAMKSVLNADRHIIIFSPY